MHTATDKMIAALAAFEASDHAVFDLYQITNGFDRLPDPDQARIIPSMFSVIERCGEADLGCPGPLVHCIELLEYEEYLSLLVDSVRRQPTYLSVWMVNRILNGDATEDHRRQLLELLRSVSTNPVASASVVAEAYRFLQRHADAG
jgi:hypothetical protein